MKPLTDPFLPRPAPGERGALPMGWHESTWDLLRGVVVVEEVPLDLLPGEWQQRLVTAPCGRE